VVEIDRLQGPSQIILSYRTSLELLYGTCDEPGPQTISCHILHPYPTATLDSILSLLSYSNNLFADTFMVVNQTEHTLAG
jgi:hypothetical protein